MVAALGMLFLLCCGIRLRRSGGDLSHSEHSWRTVSTTSQVTHRWKLSAHRCQVDSEAVAMEGEVCSQRIPMSSKTMTSVLDVRCVCLAVPQQMSVPHTNVLPTIATETEEFRGNSPTVPFETCFARASLITDCTGASAPTKLVR